MRRRQSYSQELIQRRRDQARSLEESEARRGLRRGRGYVSKEASRRAAVREGDNFHRALSVLPDDFKFKPGYCPFGCGKYLERGMIMHARWCKKNPKRT